MSEFKHIEGTGKPLKVVSPINNEAIVRGKEYKVTKHIHLMQTGWSFYIEANYTEALYCRERNCAHLGMGNWIVTERES